MCLARQDCARPLWVRNGRETSPQATRGGPTAGGQQGAPCQGWMGLRVDKCPCASLQQRASCRCPGSSPSPWDEGCRGALAQGSVCWVSVRCRLVRSSSPWHFRSCAELSVVPAAIRLQSAEMEAGWSWVIDAQCTNPAHPLQLPWSSSGACAALSPQL